MLITLLAPVPGLQSVLNGAASTMGFDVQPDEFIQVLNTGSSHWVMVSTIGALHPTVHIYDRLFSQLGAKLQEQNSRSKTPGADSNLLATSRQEIIIKFIDVPMQSGTNDCGLFAIAYAVTLALGQQPEEYQFNQAGMRTHFLHCLEKQNISMFPVLRRCRIKKDMVRAVQKLSVYCKCRMPQMERQMIECSKCKEWYHL